MADYTATVTSVAYEDTAEIVELSPLGARSVQTLILDNFRLTWDVGELVEQPHVFNPDAVGNRMAVYGLDDERAAVDALVREVVFGYSGLDPETGDDLGGWGGIDSRIAVEWTPEALADWATLLAQFSERIAAARKQFTKSSGPSE